MGGGVLRLSYVVLLLLVVHLEIQPCACAIRGHGDGLQGKTVAGTEEKVLSDGRKQGRSHERGVIDMQRALEIWPCLGND